MYCPPFSFSVPFSFCLSPLASVPAPKLKFTYWVNESNIVLNTILHVSCDAPRGAPYPVTVSVGKLESPSQTPETTEPWVTSEVITYPTSVGFTIPAIAKYEGKMVCWYQSTRTELKISEFSNTIPLVVCKFDYAKISVLKIFPKFSTEMSLYFSVSLYQLPSLLPKCLCTPISCLWVGITLFTVIQPLVQSQTSH